MYTQITKQPQMSKTN